MFQLLKKYHLTFLILLVVTGILLLFIPNEETHYLRTDFEEIKSKADAVSFWATIIVIIILLFGLRKIKKAIQFVHLFFLAAIMSLSLFFLFNPIFLSAMLLFNRLPTQQTLAKTYTVTYINQNNKTLIIWDNDLKSNIWADELIGTEYNKKINVSDTITVSFNKGLLGFRLDPSIQTIIKVN